MSKSILDTHAILNNSISAIIAAIIIGAGAIIWDKAATLDTRISAANSELMKQQVELKNTQQVLSEKVAKLELVTQQLDRLPSYLNNKLIGGMDPSLTSPLLNPDDSFSAPSQEEISSRAREIEQSISLPKRPTGFSVEVR